MQTQSKESSKKENKETTSLLLRMSTESYLVVKSESQRINVSVTSMINFIIADFVKRQKINKDDE